ncbi:MAG: hypothetical protein ABIT38_07090 [Gemmatimonadaceae bacterium]
MIDRYPGLDEEFSRALAALVDSGVLPTLEHASRRMSVPIWWHHPSAEHEALKKSGSVCFVHTGERLIAISAAHVHRDYEAIRHDVPDVVCQLGAHTFQPHAQLIDIDDRLDLVTYAVSEWQVMAADADIHNSRSWPPSIDPKAVCLVGGWPWRLTTSRAEASDFQFLHFLGVPDSHSDKNLGLVTATASSIAWGPRALPSGLQLGGMSGGPFFTLHETGLVHLTLTGIVYEYHEEFEIVFGRPLSLINADGSLVR